MSYTVILKVALTSAVYALVMFAQKHMKDMPEDLDVMKLLATVGVGALVGVGLFLAGDPVSQEIITVQLAAYAGLVSVGESLLKTGYRWLKSVF